VTERAWVLEARSLSMRYGQARVVRDVTLGVASGEVLAVLGPTGAGKTTLFRALVGDRPPQHGSIRLCGRDVTHERLWVRARLGVSYIPQGPSVLPDLSVAGNLTTFEAIRGGQQRGAQHWAAVVDLQQRLALRASELSGGERRRLEVARALVGAPVVIVCDEPFSGMDPISARCVAQLLRSKANEGLAIVLADHHAKLALDICDRALLLVDGQLQVQGAAADFRVDPIVRERYLGKD
jgi:lipopolysaccharide export system ATP-binding protein